MFNIKFSKRHTRQGGGGGLCYSKITSMANFRLQFMDTSSLIEKKKLMIRYKGISLRLRKIFAICIPVHSNGRGRHINH